MRNGKVRNMTAFRWAAILAISMWTGTLVAPAFAGDRLLGVILVTDGGFGSNATTGYGPAAGAASGCCSSANGRYACSCPQAFAIGQNALLSVQCKDQGALFAANRSAVDAGEGIRLATDQFLTTSVGAPMNVSLPDGGLYTGGSVAIAPLPGATRADCNIYERQDNE